MLPKSRSVVDIHAHIYPLGYLRELTDPQSPVVAVPDGEDFDLMIRGHRFVRVTPAFYDADVRLRSMDAAGVTTQVLSLSPPMVYWADEERAVRLSRIVNDELATFAARHPDRFIAGGTLPLQTPDAAVEEIRRIVGMGHRMVAFPTHLGGVDLDDPSLDPVYAELEAHDLPIFVHPYMPRVPESLKRDRFDPLIGFPSETGFAALRVISGGVLDRHPGLRFCWSHLGGTLPFIADRFTSLSRLGAEDFPGIGGNPERPHEEYLARFWYDLVVYSDRTLRFGFEFAGSDHLMFGTDCPFFSDASALMVGLIDDATWMPESQREAVFANAERFLRPV